VGFDYVHSVVARALRPPGDHGRGSHDRQRLELHPQPSPSRAPRRGRHHTHHDQTSLPMAERQSRTLQPDPAIRVGLPDRVPQQHRTNRCT
jgi:hypothetical protein